MPHEDHARAEEMPVGEKEDKGKSAICSYESIHDSKSPSLGDAVRVKGAMAANTFLISEIFVDFENNNQRCI